MGPLSNFRRKLTRAAPPSTPEPAPAAAAAPAVVCRPARREEISLALRVVLGAHGHPADDAQVVDFMQFALRRGFSLADLWLAVRTADGTVAWAVLPVVSPGRTLLMLGPSDPPHRRGSDSVAIAETLIERVCAHFAGRGVQLAQVLLDPSDAVSRRLYESRGFGRVAELLYLQASPRRKTVAPVLPPGFALIPYRPEIHAPFVAAIAETYQHSLDCPSLNGLREMEDVLAGHKASGEFEPDLWLMLCEQEAGVPAGDGAGPAPKLVARGVLLLSLMQPGDTLELVYLGLTPAARGRGLGDLLVKQALAFTAARGMARLSLAVDSNNAPALKLYYRHGLQRVASKLAMMRVLEAPPATEPTTSIAPTTGELSTARAHVR